MKDNSAQHTPLEKESVILEELLKNFYLIADIPIWIYSCTEQPLYSYPAYQHPCEDFHPAINSAKTCKHQIIRMGTNVFHIVSVLSTLTEDFGYTLLEVPASFGTEKANAFAMVLELLTRHILEKNLVVLEWQRYIDQFKQGLWNHLDMDLSIHSLCELLGVGKTTLYKQFRLYSGTTIAHFITQARIEKAMELLEKTNLSVTEISDKVGFNNYNYFCRVFKKKIGISPQKYRLQNIR